MNILDVELKLQVISIAISTLTQRFEKIYGRFPELELEQFANTFGANHGAVEALLDESNRTPIGRYSDILKRYPTFWHDLARNLGYESVPANVRPPRDVT